MTDTNDENNACNVCCEKYNNSTKLKIVCEYGDCNYECCKSCVRQYLLTTTLDPHCMNCRKHWNQQFLVSNLNKSFITKDYKEHRTEFLCDREISKLPETMELASRYKQIKILEQKKLLVTEEINKLNRLLNEAKNKNYDIERSIRKLRNNENETEKKKFIMACANDDCRGFLNINYKCDICNLFTCSKCLEIIGFRKNEEHKCNADNIETANLIKKDTKPCPSCATRIFKISGCDQMWCTECKTGFSWTTGKIENGVIHNPHFFEYQRNNNNNNNNNNQPLNMCNANLPDYWMFSRMLSNLKKNKQTELSYTMSNIYRIIAHIIDVEYRRYQYNLREYSNTDYERVKYINKDLDRESLKKLVYFKDKKRRKVFEINQVYELFINVGKDIINGITNYTYTDIDDFIKVVLDQIDIFNNVQNYCNNQFKIISASYSCVTPYINNFKITTQKHNSSILSNLNSDTFEFSSSSNS